MITGRSSTLLWSFAGALLLAAGVVVVVAMRPVEDAPRPAPLPLDDPAGTRSAAAPSTQPAAPLQPAALTRVEVPTVEPAPVLPVAQAVAEPIAQEGAQPTPEPGGRAPRLSDDEQLQAGMERMVAGQEAQIVRLEATVVAAEQAGDVDGAHLRRSRLVTLRNMHATLRAQLDRLREEHALSDPQ